LIVTDFPGFRNDRSRLTETLAEFVVHVFNPSGTNWTSANLPVATGSSGSIAGVYECRKSAKDGDF
jgi:hypothetical protein